jgi:hypothetical protein
MPPPYIVKTPHFSYILNMEQKHSTLNPILFRVGDEKFPCLEATVFMPGGDERLADLVDEAILSKIDAIEQCALEYDDEHSFGTELLFSFINLLKSSYKHVKRLRLHDASYIPCNRSSGETLDLLTYSIATQGKTWYEMKAGAYPDPNVKSSKTYNDEITNFISPEFKHSIPFIKLYSHIAGNNYAKNIIDDSFASYESMYNFANTFPDFFRSLSKAVPKQEKCKFFKGWLEYFVADYVTYPRDWIIDIDNNPTLGNVLNTSHARPMRPRTRHRRKQQKHKTRKF